jgi:MiaB-like tRNA modifying enzyme
MKKVFIESYGCSANLSDSQVIAGLLKEKKFEIVNSPKKSNLNIINTCIVKSPTEQRMIFRIKELTKLKKPLIVAGCMPKTSQRTIEKINPEASMIGPDSVEGIVDVASKTIDGKKIIFTKDLRRPKICLPKLRSNPVIDIVPICIGCLGSCSYCSVRFAKGNLFSYPKEKIIKEIKSAVKGGCKEIWITSQDNSCYGKDINSSLSELLNEICKIDGEFFARVGMMNPMHTIEILNKLIEAYKDERIFKFLHVPVQSGSNEILEKMKRGYAVEDFIEIVEKFRKDIPDLTLSTDIIVGFPGETEEDFNKTVYLIQRIKPDIVNISKFGSRPGTEAAKLENLDVKTVNERSSVIYNLVKKISLENNKKWIGWRGKVLVDEKTKNGFVARNFSYKPIVLKTKKNIFGKIVEAEIENATANCLIAK